MDLWELIKALARRWYLTVPLLILTGFGAMTAGNGVAPTYTASAGGVFLAPVLVLPPELLTPNPWSQAGVTTTAAAVQGSVVNPTAKQAFVSAGLSGEYSVLMDNRSVIFNTFASAPTVEVAQATLDRVVQTMRDDLRAKQAQYQVPEDQQISIQMFTETSIVTTRDGLTRVLLVAVGLGLVVSVTLVLVVDALLLRRERTRVSDDPEDGGTDEPAAGEERTRRARGGAEDRATPEHARA